MVWAKRLSVNYCAIDLVSVLKIAIFFCCLLMPLRDSIKEIAAATNLMSDPFCVHFTHNFIVFHFYFMFFLMRMKIHQLLQTTIGYWTDTRSFAFLFWILSRLFANIYQHKCNFTFLFLCFNNKQVLILVQK